MRIYLRERLADNTRVRWCLFRSDPGVTIQVVTVLSD
jgi:hypothetical protein